MSKVRSVEGYFQKHGFHSGDCEETRLWAYAHRTALLSSLTLRLKENAPDTCTKVHARPSDDMGSLHNNCRAYITWTEGGKKHFIHSIRYVHELPMWIQKSMEVVA